MSNPIKARAEAAVWVVKLHGPDRSPRLEAAFRDWLTTDAEHRRQFERVTSVWEDARGIPVGGLSRLARWNRSPRKPAWAIAATLLLSLAAATFWGYSVWVGHVYRTAVGEQRVVRLGDGSHVSLNSDTRLEVKFSRERRHLVLSRGEAYFEVAHNALWPFIVSAGGHNVTAVGTSFQVRYDSGLTAVTVVEGKVAVSELATAASIRGASQDLPSERGEGTRDGRQQSSVQSSGPLRHPGSADDDGRAASAPVVMLTPGQRLLLSGVSLAKLDSPHMDAVTAWRRGEVVLEKTPLAEAIAEMNRYEDDKLVIESPRIAALRISGIYRVGESVGFAQTVAKLYHLQITVENREIRISEDRLGGNEQPP
jgi:transmembrane sensor